VVFSVVDVVDVFSEVAVVEVDVVEVLSEVVVPICVGALVEELAYVVVRPLLVVVSCVADVVVDDEVDSIVAEVAV